MTDKLIRAIVTIPNDNGIPADSSVNVWHFDGDSGNTLAAYESATMTLLTTFYQAIDGSFLSANTASPATVKMYDMRDAIPRVPFYTDTIALTPGATAKLPGEVAVCLSYSADVASGESAARRRGRIFLGPCTEDCGVDTTGEFRIKPAAITVLCNAASTLSAGVAMASGSMRWAVFSPTMLAGGSTIDDAFNDVTHGWVDNAFDTQRRRGALATTRTTWT